MLVVILGLVGLVVWSGIRKRRKGGGCVDCADEACAFHGTAHEPGPGEILPDGTQATCPAVGRAFEKVEAALGATEEPDGTGETGESGGADRNAGRDAGR